MRFLRALPLKSLQINQAKKEMKKRLKRWAKGRTYNFQKLPPLKIPSPKKDKKNDDNSTSSIEPQSNS